jgi:hypothetical protein
MKLKFCTALLTVATIVAPLSVMAEKAQDPAAAKRAAVAQYGKMPLSFEPTGSSARFLARSGSYAVSVGAKESSVAVADAKAGKHQTLHFAFENANPAAPLEAMEPQPGVINYYLGKDASHWRLGVKSYGKLRAQNVYPGVDVIYYGDHRRLEFDFVIAPKADPSVIALSFSGMEKLSKDSGGDLVAEIGGRSVRFAKPYAYQKVGEASKAVAADYELTADGKVHLHLGDYDRNAALIVDPVVSYATYLGGSLGDVGNGIAVDNLGRAYVTGQTCSSNFPSNPSSINEYDDYISTNPGSCDAYVTKFTADGTGYLYTTIIGGTNPNIATAVGNGIALDSANNAYIVGTTNFTDLPLNVNHFNGLNTYQGGDSDAFIVMLAANGTLVKSSYLGGSAADFGFGIAVDTSKNVIVVGETCSLNFPGYNAFETMVEFCVAFVTKLDNNLDIGIPPGYGATALSPLITFGGTYFFSEFYAGQPVPPYPITTWQGTTTWIAGQIYPYGAVIVDTNGNVELNTVDGGSTGDIEPGTPNAPGSKTIIPPWAAAKNGTTSEVFGGGTIVWKNLGAAAIPVAATTKAYGVALDPVGDIIVAGGTNSASLAPFSYYAGSGAWVLKVSGVNGGFLYGTVLETNASDKTSTVDTARAVAVDTSGNAFVTGTASGTIFTSNTAYKPIVTGVQNAFLMSLDKGGGIIYGTYLGGTGNDQGLGVAADGSGAAYVTGSTRSTDFPTINPLDNPNSIPVANAPILSLLGQQNAFISKFSADGSGLLFSAYLGGSGTDQGNAIAIDTGNAGNMYVAGTTSSPDLEQLDPSTYTPPQPNYGGGVGDAFVAMVKGSSLPTVTITPGGLNFGAQDVGLASNAVAIEYMNTNASSTVDLSTIAFAGDYKQVFPGTTPGDCPSGLIQPSTYCNIWVVFTPSGPGSRLGTITITDDASSAPHIIHLSGTGEVPQDMFSPTSLTFTPAQIIGTPSTLTVKLTNTGQGTLDIASWGITAVTGNTGSADFSQTSTCGDTLNSGGSCTFSVIFNPSMSGTRTANLTIFDNAPGSPHNITLQGEGAQVKAPTITPLTLPFTVLQPLNVTSAAQMVTVTNNDPASSLLLSAPVTTGDFQVAAAQTTCTTSLAPNLFCVIGVTFTPTAVGQLTGTLSISSNAASAPVVVQLTGTGGAAASGTISLSPSALPFGPQQMDVASLTQTVTLTNTGVGSMTIPASGGITIAGSSDFAIVSSNCPATLAANAHCSIGLTFTPTAANAETATLTLNGNASNAPQKVDLSGTGVAGIQLSPATLTFPGSQLLGTTSNAQTVTLTNSSSTALTIAGIAFSGVNPHDFNSSATTCPWSPATLAPNTTCTITVIFTPTIVGGETATLTVTGNASNSPQSVTLSGTGTNVAPPTPPPFTVTPESMGVSVIQGGTATYNLTVAPVNSFSNSINFTCSGPKGSSCSFSVNPLPMNQTTTLSVNTTGGSGTMAKSRVGARSIFLALLPFSMMGMLLINKRRGIWLVLLLLAMCVFLGSVGCGASSGGTSSGGLDPGTYQVTVTATSGGTTLPPITLSLVVNKQ